jgi:hypothetical protein
MSFKGGSSSDVMRKYQAATEWKDTTRGVIKQATKFGELMDSIVEEGDNFTEELLKVHKLLVGPSMAPTPNPFSFFVFNRPYHLFIHS